MDAGIDYLEQFCGDCHDETDHMMAPEASNASCLRCGSSNPIQDEDERLMAFMRRVKDQETAYMNSWRDLPAGVPELAMSGGGMTRQAPGGTALSQPGTVPGPGKGRPRSSESVTP